MAENAHTQAADGATPLHRVVRAGDAATVKRLLENGTNVNTPDGDGATALHWAAWADKTGLVRILLEHGADVDAQERTERPRSFGRYGRATRQV